LARAVGEGFRRVSRERPLVLLLDTYEIVATADSWLRMTIHAAGARVVWIIAGRDNLAASRPTDRFVGYSAEFPRHLTVWDTQELAIEYVEAYLRNRAPARPPTHDDAVAIHRATWGVPLALRQAADLWEKGVPLAAITEGIPDYAPREELVRLMCERVLLHVEHDAGGEADRRALYALAMQPRPDPEIQTAIMRLVDGIFDLHKRLAELARRYSVVRLAGGARLHEKMGEFVHEYLLRTEASASDMIKQIAGRAVEILRLRRAKLEEDLFDLAERIESEDWRQTTLDLVDWLFWQDERAAWRELTPRFVEGLGYNRDFAESLLAVAGNFELKLSKDGYKRLKQFQLAEDNRDVMLTELERLAKKGRWLDDADAEATAERYTILTLWRGRWLADTRRYPEALEILQAAEQTLPASAPRLRQQLGQAFIQLSRRIHWPPGSPFPVLTEAGIQAARRAVALAPELSRSWSILVSALRYIQPEEAVAAAQKAVELEPQSAIYWHSLGLAYGDRRRDEEAIAAFRRAIELDPTYVRPWTGLGFRYQRQGRYEEALKAYQQALEIDPHFTNCWSGLGALYGALGRFEEAVKAYQRAIELHPEQIYPWQARSWNGLGMIYRDQGHYDLAINAYRKATDINPKGAFNWVMLGAAHELAGDLEKARQSYQQAIQAQPQQSMGYSSLASVLRKLGREAEAREYIAQARELTHHESLYDQACLEAIAGNTEAALEHLSEALSQYPNLRRWARRDPDLEWLHGHPRFEALVADIPGSGSGINS